MVHRNSLSYIAVACLIILAGCTTSGLTMSDAADRSDVVEDVDISIDRENIATVTVTYENSPTVAEETCWYNPATKITQCDTTDHNVDITQSQLLISTDADTTEGDHIIEPVEQEGQTVVFEYESDSETELTVQSDVVGVQNDKEWGTVPFGFEVDSTSQSYIVSDSTWYDEVF